VNHLAANFNCNGGVLSGGKVESLAGAKAKERKTVREIYFLRQP